MLPPPALRAELEVRSRALAAFSLYQRRPCPILTFEAPMQGVPSSGSELVVDTLVQAGVPLNSIVQRKVTTSTAEELLMASNWLKKQPYRGLRLVSASYHLPRVARKASRFSWPHVLYSPEMLASHTAANALLFEGRSRPDVRQLEHRQERLWALADGLASCLPEVIHTHLEIAAGRWLRRRLISTRTEVGWGT